MNECAMRSKFAEPALQSLWSGQMSATLRVAGKAVIAPEAESSRSPQQSCEEKIDMGAMRSKLAVPALHSVSSS